MTRSSGSLLWRAVRWRAGTSVLTVLLASIAILAAAVGPLYLRATDDSVLRTTVSGASVQDSGVTVQAAAVPDEAERIAAAERLFTTAGGTHRFYAAPLTTDVAGAAVSDRSGTPYITSLEARTRLCAHVGFSVGHCPTGSRQVAVSTRTAALVGIHEGEVLPVSVRAGPDVSGKTDMLVVGLYRTPTDLGAPYWWGTGNGDFPFGTSPSKGQFLVDPLIATPTGVLDLPAASRPTVIGQLALVARSVHVGSVGAFRHALDGATNAVEHQDRIVPATQISGILAGISHQEGLVRVTVLLVAAQLLLLALWVLAGLMAQGSEARRSDVRLARLCGFPNRSVFVVASAEPLVLCLVGVPIGLALAWLLTVVARDTLLDPTASVGWDGLVVAATAAAVLGTVAAVAVGSRRLLRQPAIESSGLATGAGWRARAGRTADIVVLVVAAVALVELHADGVLSGGTTNPLASVAPALISVGVGIIGVRLLLVAGGAVVRATRWSSHVVAFLVSRHLTRRPLLVRQVRVLVVAVGLACFATATWAVARDNQAKVAAFSVGASQVVTVAPAAGVDPISAVERLDPSGRSAMAVAVVRTDSSTLLAVDPSRLAAVASWSSGITNASLARTADLIDPPVAPAVELRGRGLQVATATSESVTPGTQLVASVFDERYGDTGLVALGALRPGLQVHVADVSGFCELRCRLNGLTLSPADPDSPGALDPRPFVLTLRSMAVRAGAGHDGAAGWRPIDADLGPGGWRGAAGEGITLGHVTTGLAFDLPSAALQTVGEGVDAASIPLLAPAVVPAVIPAVVTDTDVSLNQQSAALGTVPVQALDGATLDVAVRATATGLPGVGTNAVMIDLGIAEDAQSEVTSSSTHWQVWLAPGGSRLVGRLATVGLEVVAVDDASTVRARLRQTGPALAIDFLLLSAALAVVVAAAGTLTGLTSAARQRAGELAALGASGVPRRLLVRSLLAETVVLVAGGALGAIGGVLAARVALPSIPELAAVPAVPPLGFGLPVVPLVALVAAVLVVVVGSGVAAVWLTIRRVQPSLLRTTAE